MRTSIFIFFFLLVVASGDALAEECRIEKQATLPITFNKFVPTVPVTINGHQVNIGIDTGAETELVTPETVNQLSLPEDPNHSTTAIGTGQASIVHNAVFDLEFAGIKYPKISAAVVPVKMNSNSGGAKIFGPETPMAGLIGTDILSNYDIEYNPSARTLTLYTVNGCDKVTPQWQGKFIRIPASLTKKRRLIMPFGLNKHKMTAVFDTGASGMRIARESVSKAGVTEEMLAADSSGEGSGIGGHSYKSPLHQFDSLIIGREVFQNAKIDVVDFPASDADALIGEDYMRNRRFWLSYSTGAIFIQGITAQ
jgi:predicted aspartyl protease